MGGTRKDTQTKDLFILPNRYGVYVAFLVFASFAIGYRVQNNFILLGVIFLFLIYMLSLIASVRLQGLSFSFRTAPYYMASNPASHAVITTPDRFIIWNSTFPHLKNISQPSQKSGKIRPIVRLPRGIHTVPALKVQTRFLLASLDGLVISVNNVTVCPTPDRTPTSIHAPPKHPSRRVQMIYSPPQQHYQKTGFCRIREHLRMVISSRIDWKRFAATGNY